MTAITEQDLLDAIEAFLIRPKQPGEYTVGDIAKEKGVSEPYAERAIAAMLKAGLVTFRDIPARNGKGSRLYRMVSHN